MTETVSRPTGRPGVAGIFLLCLLLLLMGIPFAGMAVMTVLLLSGRSQGSRIALAVAVLGGVFVASDFVGAVIAAVGSGAMTTALRSGRDLSDSAGIASAGAVTAALAGLIAFPRMSLLSPESVDMLMQAYAATGLSPAEVRRVFEVFLAVIPALLALWAAGGTVAAASVVRLVSLRKGIEVPRGGGIRMGLVPAWIMIASLAANLLPRDLPTEATLGAVNILVFLTLPYGLVGLSVLRAALLTLPGTLMPAALFAILLPPVALGLLVLVGITDTLFDYRLRLSKLRERNRST